MTARASSFLAVRLPFHPPVLNGHSAQSMGQVGTSPVSVHPTDSLNQVQRPIQLGLSSSTSLAPPRMVLVLLYLTGAVERYYCTGQGTVAPR
jgi:hypothetical protein